MKHDVTPEVQKSEQEWKAQLGPERYHILREAGTEAPFSGSLLKSTMTERMSAADAVSRSLPPDAKFESHCGWPSFTHPQEQENVRLFDDYSHGMQRIEVRCKRCDSHLGHVFDDGPGPEGTRYCINSASLDFQPSSQCIGLAAMLAVGSAGRRRNPLRVLYAGSLVTPMEGPIKSALAQRGIDFLGEPGGSKELANLILANLRSPDVFIASIRSLSRDSAIGSLRRQRLPERASASPGRRTRASRRLFDSVRARKRRCSQRSAAWLKIGRTDPMLDPKGSYTVMGVTTWLGTDGERQLLGNDENAAQIFPEEDLLARVETGQVDVGFFYQTEAVARNWHFIPLPGAAALTDKITYTLAIMKNAPHPAARKLLRISSSPVPAVKSSRLPALRIGHSVILTRA